MDTEILNIAEIKNLLHKFIVETNDFEVLNKVKNYFSSLDKEKDWWNILSNEEKQQLEVGLTQLDNDEFVDYQQVKKKADILLGRYE